MNILFRKITASFLLVAFMFILAPEYLLHDFADHKDTVDGYSKTETVSTKHIHCESLLLQVQFFTETEGVSLPAIYVHQLLSVVAPVQQHFRNNHYYTSLRGPPTV